MASGSLCATRSKEKGKGILRTGKSIPRTAVQIVGVLLQKRWWS